MEWVVLAVLFFLGLPIAAVVLALAARSRLYEIERQQRHNAEVLDHLQQQLSRLAQQMGTTVPEPPRRRPEKMADGQYDDVAAPLGVSPLPPWEPITESDAAPTAEKPVETLLQPETPESVSVESEPIIDEAAQVTDWTAAEPDKPVEEPAPATDRGGDDGRTSWLRVPPLPASGRIDWESLVGVKLFSWIAGVALVIAAVFFLRYSIDRGWLGPPIRMAIGLTVGAGLLVVCELRAARRYPVTANALDAAGIAILFATLFASYARWNLLPQLPVFVLMSLVTAVAVLLSVRRESIFIALLGLIGGFATPALLSTGEDRPIGLFGYLLLLNLGAAWVAQRKHWPLLSAVCVGFTTLYQWVWVGRYLDPPRLALAMGIFTIFPLVHFAAVSLSRRDGEGEADALLEHIALAATALALLFVVYVAAVPAYGERYVLLFAFVFMVAAGLTAIAIMRGPELLHVIGGAATVSAVTVWFLRSYSAEAWPGVLWFVAAFTLFYLVAPLVAERVGNAFTEEAKFSYVIAPLLLFAFPFLALIEPQTADPGLLFCTLFVLLAAAAYVAIVREVGMIQYLSALSALAAEAVWSSLRLTPERLLPALAMYATFGLLYLGVPLLAQRMQKSLDPRGSGAAVAFLSIALLFFLATGEMASSALWGIGLLLLIFNAGLFLEASRGRQLHSVAMGGVMLSWLVLAVWWFFAMSSALLIPALVVVGAFAVLVVAGNAWLQEEQRDATKADRAEWLALVGHGFLLFVATRPSFSVPPWPLFGILALLDVAIGAAALHTRRAHLFAAATALSHLILLTWIEAAKAPPWPLIGIVAACSVAALALLWLRLAERRGGETELFARAMWGNAFLAEIVVIFASGQPDPPSALWLALAHVGLVAAVLVVAAWRQELGVNLVAVALPAIQVVLWSDAYLKAGTWVQHLCFAAALYLPFMVNPLVLGARAGRAREPYIAAIVASGVFFLVARQCMIAGGVEHVIGILPVMQAVLMMVLLARLLAIEEPDERRSGRVAMTAGAALAFITVAIPLQLEREWITIGWALECAALAWLYRRIPHRGLVLWTAGLAVAVMIRLCLNPAVLTYHPRSEAPIFNWFLYTYLTAAAALVVAARLLRDTDDAIVPTVRLSRWLPGAAVVLLFLLLNIEIADFYSTGTTLTFDFSAGLAEDLTYTIGWAVFAIGLLSAGIGGGGRVPRVAALGLLVVTVVKCFLHDLWQLGGLYRVGSFVGLAVCLALVAVLMQRFVLGAQKEAV